MRCNSGFLDVNAMSTNTGNPIFTLGIINSSNDEKNFCEPEGVKDTYNCSQYANFEGIKA
jgi:hypothetical protein